MMKNIFKQIQHLASWFFGSPFRQLPPEFGDPVPPELRAFEVAGEEMQRHPQGHVQPSFSDVPKQNRSYH